NRRREASEATAQELIPPRTLHFSNFAPRAPIHGQCRQTNRPAVIGKRIEERTGHSVTRLSRRSDDGGHRREHHEEVERQLLCEYVKVPGAVDLRRKHARKATRRQIADGPLVDQGGCMDDAAQRRHGFRYFGQEVLQGMPVCHVARADPNRAADFAQFLNNGADVSSESRSADKSQAPCTATGEPASGCQSDFAERARDEVRGVRWKSEGFAAAAYFERSRHGTEAEPKWLPLAGGKITDPPVSIDDLARDGQIGGFRKQGKVEPRHM